MTLKFFPFTSIFRFFSKQTKFDSSYKDLERSFFRVRAALRTLFDFRFCQVLRCALLRIPGIRHEISTQDAVLIALLFQKNASYVTLYSMKSKVYYSFWADKYPFYFYLSFLFGVLWTLCPRQINKSHVFVTSFLIHLLISEVS